MKHFTYPVPNNQIGYIQHTDGPNYSQCSSSSSSSAPSQSGTPSHSYKENSSSLSSSNTSLIESQRTTAPTNIPAPYVNNNNAINLRQKAHVNNYLNNDISVANASRVDPNSNPLARKTVNDSLSNYFNAPTIDGRSINRNVVQNGPSVTGNLANDADNKRVINSHINSNMPRPPLANNQFTQSNFSRGLRTNGDVETRLPDVKNTYSEQEEPGRRNILGRDNLATSMENTYNRTRGQYPGFNPNDPRHVNPSIRDVRQHSVEQKFANLSNDTGPPVIQPTSSDHHGYGLDNSGYSSQRKVTYVNNHETKPNSHFPYENSINHFASVDNRHVMQAARGISSMGITDYDRPGQRTLDSCDVLRVRNILPKKVECPRINLPPELPSDLNCSPELFRCTLTKIPSTKSLLEKSRLPLGILIHPFRDLEKLSVVQCNTIARCKACRTYINPFVFLIDSKHWKCNLCYRANELPDEFRYNALTKSLDDPFKRPEMQSATIEYIASSEYMVRPPQPAVYLFVLDVSRIATQTGYLATICELIWYNIRKLPGDSRTMVGFVTFDSSVHFYSFADGLRQPHQMVVTDIDDIFIPCPDNLIVNLQQNLDLVRELLKQLPLKYKESYVTENVLGAALQAAYKLIAATGGRVTVFQCCLPNTGPGALKSREDPSLRATDKVYNLAPATDFYKKLALECSTQHIAVDLFVLNSQYVDLATIGGISQVSGGCIHHFPLYDNNNPIQATKLTKVFVRYMCRKIGMEAVMRIRCTKGLSIHSFHGNFFVRTTDLLALPNINPDAGFGMQVSIDENLSDVGTVCFQAALLYTTTKGERRIRVHTLCLPVTSNMQDAFFAADQQCIIGLLSKMAVDRSIQSSVSDAREAFVNAVCDTIHTYKLLMSNGSGSMCLPSCLLLFPLYVLALLKNTAFRLMQDTRLDDRVFAMNQMKCLPLNRLIKYIYPDLYRVDDIANHPITVIEESRIPHPPLVHLSAEFIDPSGIYLMDDEDSLTIFVGRTVLPAVCRELLGYDSMDDIPDDAREINKTDSMKNKLLYTFIEILYSEKPFDVLRIIKDSSPNRNKFYEKLVEDKYHSGISYHEFLQKIRSKL